MAREWFVQHGGKQHGPLNSATLKKLAAEGKITATTQVRLGATGAWVPASRVQGLFAAPPAHVLPAVPPAPPTMPQVAPPPIAPPVAARPMGTPVPRPALGSFIPQARPAPPAAHPIAAKLIGAVALVLGTLALSIFWLPVMGPLGWLALPWVGWAWCWASLALSSRSSSKAWACRSTLPAPAARWWAWC